MDPNYPDVVLRPVGGGRRCKVVFSYSPQNEDELELKEKDEIEFISEVEEGWWRGRLCGRVGVFPSNFVVELPGGAEDKSLSASEGDISAPLSSPEEPVPVLPPKPVREQCRVLFSYDAAIEDELTLCKGDIVNVISKDVEDKGWWKGELRGKIGLFPDNFVELITSSDESSVKPSAKPDRPVKSIPLISTLGNKKSDSEKTDPTPNKPVAESKSTDLGLIKPDTVASHRKSLEEKVANEAKKPLRPPVSGKPKPPGSKPSSVKRLSAEITDLVDGALQSKLNSRLKTLDVVEPTTEEIDLDSVGRSDMLTNITASRPRAPGRRPPSFPSQHKDNEETSPLTNGSSDGAKVEKSLREKQKQHLPFMDELRVNLKSSKPVVDSTVEVKQEKSFALWGTKANSHNNIVETSTSSTNSVSHDTSHVKSSHRESSVTASHRTESTTTSLAKMELSPSHRTDSIATSIIKTEPMDEKRPEDLDGSKSSLRLRIEKLERTILDLASQLKEETERRRQLEKEVRKLADLVTQV